MFGAENSIPGNCLSNFMLSGCASLVFTFNHVAGWVEGEPSFDGANEHRKYQKEIGKAYVFSGMSTG